MARQGKGASVETRVYMEGILVENGVVSVSCHGGTNTPASCSIELVPTNTIRHIMPGTWVHVFVTDPWELEPAGDLSDFNLLFEGVVTARGFSRMDDGRNFVIQCASPEVYWANAKQFWLNLGSANGDIFDQLAIQTSGGYGQFGKISSTGTFGYMISKMAFKRKDDEQAEERFIDTLVSVLDDIGNVNPFYTNARNRFRITDRIVRGPAGNTEKLFQLALLSDFLDGISGRQSGQTNLVDVVNQLLSAIMHEWVSVLAPSYIKTRIFERDVFGNIKRIKNTVRRRGPRNRSKVDLFDFKTAIDDVVASVIFKPHVYTIDPPNFNTLFPNMYDQMSYNENFLAETTRLAMKPQLPLVGARATSGMLLQRPTEIEIFSALVQDRKRKTSKKRTPDGKFGDGESQAPTFTDYDWSTNEERVRGIVYNFINLAPAPSALTLENQGERQPNGRRKGGVPKYLQNVASYEYYKSKFMARQATVQGPLNIRAVPGFPIVMLDDSDANLNVIAYLSAVQHSVDANGSAMTRYTINYPRISREVDYNQPKFKGGFNPEGELDLSLYRDENGGFHFDQVFDGANQPPVPEWFDEAFRNTRDLDFTYRQWFGEEAGVIQNRLFQDESDSTPPTAVDALLELLGIDDPDESFLASISASVGAAIKAAGDRKDELEKILEQNENISIDDAIDFLNDRYRIARGVGKEFEEASSFTARKFTKIDQAFRFVGAAPVDLADKISSDASEAGRVPTFKSNPASSRVIDYKKHRLELFAGDTSAGSGYSGVSESDDKATTDALQDTPDILSEVQNRMSGAFPKFDTVIHTGDAVTDQAERNRIAEEEKFGTDRARYDGRPLMFDFEFRIWQESLKAAGYTPGGTKIQENAGLAEFTLDGGRARRKSAAERKDASLNRLENIRLEAERAAGEEAQGDHDPTPRKCPSMKPKTQAPTGDGLEKEAKIPLPQPLSEKQVVDLRRSVVEAYNEELKRTRGFTG